MILSDLFTPILSLAASLVLLMAAWRLRPISKKLALAWGVIGLAQLLSTFGEIIWGVYELGFHLTPFPSPADILYLAYYPVFLVGVMLLPYRKGSVFDHYKTAIDLSIVLISSVLIFVNFLVGPILQAGVEDGLLSQILGVAYPVGDLLQVSALLTLLYRIPDQGERRPYLYLIYGAIFVVVTDIGFAYQSLLGIYASGSFTDLGYWVGYILFGLAGLSLLRQIKQNKLAVQPGPASAQNLPRPLWILHLPYVLVIGAFVLLICSYYIPMVMSGVTLASALGLIILLIVLRQVLALRENQSLSRELQQALGNVRQKTQELEETNRELQAEIVGRRRIEKQLSYDALHDTLTGLPNRTLFLDRLSQATKKKIRHPDFRYSVLFLDLDSFKIINDSLGHVTGDLLLVSVAQSLLKCVRNTDTVSRLGGDEFVILMEESGSTEDVIRIADRIQKELSCPIRLDGHRAFVTVSIGIVMNACGYDHPEEILRDADLAMYQAKTHGKACYEIFNPNMRVDAISRLELENDLRRALECHELQLYYQPVLSLPEKQLVGFEALARWNDPERGLVLPANFIPLAEETGLILPLGKWVLNEACRQMQEWQQRFPFMCQLRMSVNISARQLKQPGFVQEVAGALSDSHLPGKNLVLEITESVCLNDPVGVACVIQSLANLGVEIQIDDFGTGYSSLSYLQNFRIDSIKIDRCFIDRINSRGNDSPDLIQGIMSMVHSLKIKAIAEGIENEVQLEELNRLGCSFGQGFLLAVPMNSVLSERWLDQYLKEIGAEPADRAGIETIENSSKLTP